jgi:Ser/Thr protein kinase RdoA (MazF antagonist)
MKRPMRLDPAADADRAIAQVRALGPRGLFGASEAPAWLDAAQRSRDALLAAFDRHGPLVTLRLHGDCHLGNVLWRESGPHVVDLDDACTGPAVQDLWMLVSGDADSLDAPLRLLLQGYEEWCDFDHRELALIEPLRTLRMLRHSGWLAQRWTDPAFPAAFPFFGGAAYWSQQTAQLREQLAAMADA